MYRKNTASQFVHFQGVDATTGGIKSGVTWTMRRCIDGTFAAGGGTVTEDGTTGWYKCALTQADTNGNDIGYNFTGTGAVPQTVNIVTTAADPTDAVHFGLSALPNTACTTNASLLTSGTGTDQLSVTSGRIDVGKALGTAVTLDANNVLNVSAKYWAGGLIPAPNVTGVPLVDDKYLLGTIYSTPATAGIPDINLKNIANAAVSATTAQLGVNVVNINSQVASAAAGVTFPASIASPTNITAGTITTTTNLTNAPTSGDLTAAMKTSVANAVLDAALSGHAIAGSVGAGISSAATAGDPWLTSLPGAYSAGTAGYILGTNLDAAVSTRLATSGYTAPPTAAQNATAVFTTQLTESYAALHAAPTLAQATFEIRSLLAEKAVAGTTLTTKKLDGSTTAETFTLNDGTAPTAITRAS